ncbi:hypothetical protein MYAM1_001672 [Malassezia yamatoensis]|uniref:CCD97-like C-terminal domain-containing protein n=1 Tax=Malassezia yamatoensis TaxID=253288 RepID=A0AAJ6CGL8_9BASI|nr:hypothetical protein MYAM1_001672 [Malassezia yamatoensis]
MESIRGWRDVEAWIDAVHPSEKDCEPEVIFRKYFHVLPVPLARIVGEQIPPAERSILPIIRDRRRRYAMTAPEELSSALQRDAEPLRWRHTVGTGQYEEVEDLDLDEFSKETEARSASPKLTSNEQPPGPLLYTEQDLHSDSSEPVSRQKVEEESDTSSVFRAKMHTPHHKDAPSATQRTPAEDRLYTLHNRYKNAMDSSQDIEDVDPAQFMEFEQATVARFVRGQLAVSYACDFDERWDARELFQDNDDHQMKEDAWFDDE